MIQKFSRLFFLLLFLSTCAFAKQQPFTELKGYKSTMNFCVWAPTQKDAETIAKEVEEYYHRFLADLKHGGMLKKKPQIYVFKDYEEYLDKTKQVGYNVVYTSGIAIPRSARKPAEVYSFLSDNLLNEILPHELTHLLFKEMIAGLRIDLKIPLWLNEGIAVYEEKGKRYEARVKKALKTGGTIPIAELVSYTNYPTDLKKNALFYDQSASLVDFLLSEYGGAKFLAFSRKLVRSGKTIDKALFSTYYPQIKNVLQLEDAWFKFQKDRQ